MPHPGKSLRRSSLFGNIRRSSDLTRIDGVLLSAIAAAIVVVWHNAPDRAHFAEPMPCYSAILPRQPKNEPGHGPQTAPTIRFAEQQGSIDYGSCVLAGIGSD